MELNLTLDRETGEPRRCDMRAASIVNQECLNRLRSVRKARFRAMNEPPHLTLAEEIFNAVSHGAGALVAVAGMVLLLVQSDTGM